MARVVVLGAGYAGVSAVVALESDLTGADELVWISEDPYHLVRHEVHRIIREPSAADALTIPIDDIKGPGTEFIEGLVTGIDADERLVTMAEGREIEYDYALIALGSETAYYGIPGLERNAHTLNTVSDARGIHADVVEAAAGASPSDPARIVIGGGGLSGTQVAGEIAALRDSIGGELEIILIEALENVLPGEAPSLQAAVRDRLTRRSIEVRTNAPITEAEETHLHFEDDDPISYDELVWTGGITGRAALADSDLEAVHERAVADAQFRTSSDRVFAVGDAAAIEIDGTAVPPTAQAAWDAGGVAGTNVARAVRGDPLLTWRYRDKGTVLSIGDDAVAHDVLHSPVETFGSVPARILKKAIAARWIADVASWRRAIDAWSAL